MDKIIAYHGSFFKNIKNFNVEEKPIFFSASKEYAANYIFDITKESNSLGHIYKVELNIENALDLTKDKSILSNLPDQIGIVGDTIEVYNYLKENDNKYNGVEYDCIISLEDLPNNWLLTKRISNESNICYVPLKSSVVNLLGEYCIDDLFPELIPFIQETFSEYINRVSTDLLKIFPHNPGILLDDIRHSVIKHIWYKYHSTRLTEDTRTQLVSKSRNADPYKGGNTGRGKNRFERRVYSKVANQVKSYNEIDMNKLFKSDLLEVNIPIIGETDSYTVTVSFDGVISEIARNIKNDQNRFEYKTVLQAITKVFNTTNIRVKCTCPDFKYRYAHQLIINNDSVDGTDKDPGPGRTGMANTQGKGCKHILAVLNNLSWIMQLTSVVKNYITYMDEHQHALFLKVIFPKLYGITADEAIEKNLVPEDTNLETDTKLIDTINAWSRDRGKFKPGSNKNPVAYKQQNNNEKESK